MGAEFGAQGTAALIDNKSIAVYKKEFENQRSKHRNATEAEICLRVKELIKKRLNGIVDEECRKRVMDLTTVALSSLSSTVIPFSGVAVVVAATLIQCLDFSLTLGLIPLLNVRSFNDLRDMSKNVGRSIRNSGKSSVMAGVETAVLEVLKKLGLGDWIWTEILRDILLEMIGDSAMDVVWIMTPLLTVPKYMMHRHLIKKMYRKLGDKAEIVHTQWMEENCVTKVAVQTTVVSQVVDGMQVDAFGNVQGIHIQTQEVSATQVATSSGAQTNGYHQQQAQSQQWSPYPSSSQAPCYIHIANPVMMPGTAPSYAPQPQQMPPATGSNYFQPQATLQPTGIVDMGYAPPANSAYFQPQPTGSFVMGYEPPKNSSFFQSQVGGQFQPQAAGYYQAAAAAQTYTSLPNPTYVQQLPAYGTQ
ncbi:uncharacterized protein [Physcomitrium patens]|uniref:Uncharacterized protein n=1 Tax=Physcomitrium patens TaxID=3218 RepID=A0A2K1JWG4_PHYPA|nr:uncharacterized protein LOC112288468 [Physcomitrium patens]PNR45870.1 hypothetical protein PHYPA_015641 [Physcomitrium patens]|eukprot:XP_024388431.1 uncharacterized protein LOC112288468 [Physcomitrella patens]